MTILSSINIILNGSKPIILIDQSYYIFNRYYATYNWYKRQNNEEFDHENIVENELFILAFFRHVENDILKLEFGVQIIEFIFYAWMISNFQLIKNKYSKILDRTID
jgi:hypothetical protein